MVYLRSPFSNDQTPQLQWGSVVLRPPAMADFEEWVHLRNYSKDFLITWEPLWSDHEFSKFNFRARIKYYQQLVKNDQGYPFFIFHHQQNHLLGAITITNVRRGAAQNCSVGYWIGQPFARQGFMTEALQAAIGYAFQNLTLHRIEAACLPTNQASVRLLNKCGFAHEGLARKYLKINGVWQDHLLFARLNEAPK